jgi:branched-chain amino acid transport system substrate-binding protein
MLMRTGSSTLAFALAALLAACTQPQTAVPPPDDETSMVGTTATAPANAIRLAVVGPLSGDNKVFGKQMLRGVTTAVTEINQRGGVLKRSIATVINDDACDVDKAGPAAHAVVDAGAAFVVGHGCSDASLVAADVYEAAKVIMMSPAATSPALTEGKRPYIFRITANDDYQPIAAAEYIAATFPGKRIGVVGDDSTYGNGLARIMEEQLKQRGMEAALVDHIAIGEDNYNALVGKLAAAKLDLLYFGGYQVEAAKIVTVMRQRKLKTVLFGGDALFSDEFAKLAGAAAEGTLVTFGPDLTALPPGKALGDRLRKSGQDPSGYVLNAYAAVEAWTAAVERAGSTDADAVASQLHGGSFDTVIGKVEFDEAGELKHPPVVVFRRTGGAFVQVWPQIGS